MLGYLKTYEGQLKTFLVLLVLFLAVAIYLSFHVLGVGRNAIQEEVGRRVTLRAEVVASRVGVDGVKIPGPNEAIVASPFSQTHFSRLAREEGLAALELLDRAGRVLVSSQVGRVGLQDQGWAALNPDQLGRLARGETILGEMTPGIEVAYATLSGYRPVRDGAGRLSGLLRVEDRAISLARVERDLKRLAALQAGGLASLLILVFLFAQWLLAPYRRLAATADQARVLEDRHPEGRGEPDLLVSSFRGVLEKLRRQELELQKLRIPSLAELDEGFPAETLARNLSSGMMTFDRRGHIRMANPAALRILGRPLSDLEGRTCLEALGDGDGLARLVGETLRTGIPRSREMTTYLRPGGGESHLGVGLSPLTGRDGETEGVICLLSDLTEIRHLRERVELKENLARLGELSAGIAHEFRNALATILGYGRLLVRRADSEQKEMAQALVDEAQGITKVVDDFLRFARPTRLSLSEIDLHSLLTDLGREVAATADPPSVRMTLVGEFPEIEGDEALIKQAFLNLFRNAAQSRAGAPVHLTIRGRVENDEILSIELKDDGPGIPRRDLGRIFTPFFTTRPGGTGLGLPLVQKTIVSHDGTIEAQSPPGEGACFRIRLPLKTPKRMKRSEPGVLAL